MRTPPALRSLVPLRDTLQSNAAEARNDAIDARESAERSDVIAVTTEQQAIAVDSAIELLENVGLL